MSRIQRRDVLRGLLGSGLAFGTAGWLLGSRTASAAVGATSKALMLDDVFAGYLIDADGGRASTDVVNEKLGADGVVHKHIAGVKYEEIAVVCGTGMSKVFWDWIESSMSASKAPMRRSGAILTFDQDRNFVARRSINFTNALVTEIGFPALDASSKDAAQLTVRLRPEITARAAPRKQPKGSLVTPKWQLSNFRLKLGGLEQSSANAARIDALVVRRNVPLAAPAELRDAPPSGSIEVPNLVVTVAESHADEFFAWHEDFVIKGNCSADKEKTGTLEYLNAEGTPLFTLKLGGLGVFKVAPDRQAVGDALGVKAEMYCENINLVASLK